MTPFLPEIECFVCLDGYDKETRKIAVDSECPLCNRPLKLKNAKATPLQDQKCEVPQGQKKAAP